MGGRCIRERLGSVGEEQEIRNWDEIEGRQLRIKFTFLYSTSAIVANTSKFLKLCSCRLTKSTF
jgi:hypothetical protein